MILKGKKVILRYPKISDAKTLVKEVNKPEIGQNIAAHWKNYSVRKEKVWIKDTLKKNGKRETATFIIIKKDSEEIIGSCGFNTLSLKDKYAIAGWWLKKEYWGKGYFQDFAELLLNYGFKKLKLSKIDGRVFDYNIRSKKSIMKLGFKQEGVVRQRFIKNKKPVDEHLFGMLKTEWRR